MGCYEYFSGRNFTKFLFFILFENFRILFRFLRKHREFGVVHVSDLELSFFVLPVAKLLKYPIIFNIHDNFSQRYGTNVFITYILNLTESLYIKISTVTLVPAFSQKHIDEFCHHKVHVVHNFAEDLSVSTVSEFSSVDGKLRVIYAGGLVQQGTCRCPRNFGILSDRGFSIELVFCGWGKDAEINDLIFASMENGIKAVYLGQVSQKLLLKS